MQKILCVKLGAIGDVLLTTPSLRLLKPSPTSREHLITLHYLVGKWSAPVLKANPHIDKLILIDEKIFYQKKLRCLFQLFFLLLKLAREKYDTIYLWHRNIFYDYYFSLLTFFSLSKVRVISFRRRKFLFWSRDEFPDGKHHAEIFSNLIVSSTSPVRVKRKLDFFIDDNHPKKKWQLKDWQLHLGIKEKLEEKRVVIINPGGGNNPGENVTIRRWKSKNYVELIVSRNQTQAQKKNDEIYLLVGGKQDVELANSIKNEVMCLSKRTSSYKHTLSIYNLAGKQGLEEFYLFLRALGDGINRKDEQNKSVSIKNVFITGDTGGMHIATAADICIVAIFGPTDPREKMPFMDENKFQALQTNISCLPCYQGRFRGCEQPICMDGVAVADVNDAIQRLIR